MKWHLLEHSKNFSPNLGRLFKQHTNHQYYKKYSFLFEGYDLPIKTNTYTQFLQNSLKCFNNHKILESIIEDVKENIPYPQTFGIKLDEDKKLRFELYFYYNKRNNFCPDIITKEYDIFLKIIEKHGADITSLKQIMQNIPLLPSTIWSFDFLDNKNLFGDKVNFYIENKVLYPDTIYWGNQFTKDHLTKSKEGLFLCFHSHYDLDLNRDLGYNFTETQLNIAKQILNKYKCKEYNISNKTESNGEIVFFVQYFGISDDEYEEFLISNKYPEQIIANYKNKKEFYKPMSKEITEVYKIKNDSFCIKRSGTYGLI